MAAMSLKDRVELANHLVTDQRVKDLVNELYGRNRELESLFRRKSVIGPARVVRSGKECGCASGWVQMDLNDRQINLDEVTDGTVIFIPSEAKQ